MAPPSGWVKVSGNIYKGPDGKTWALGRVYTIPVLMTGLGIPLWGIHKSGAIPSMTEMGLGLTGIAGAVAAMAAVLNHIDTPGATLTRPGGTGPGNAAP